ncbi:MAG: GIY-YIG nuclease family protein [Gemmatimonadota bacterium]|nr:GIY-YIG nuclease family protein [Gemmatimonadota bacterium]
MNRLLEIGVQPAGHWLLEGNQLTFELARHSAQKNILYAFVCDGEVKYVGKTTRTLATRMAGYKRRGKTQTTNINNHRRIREFLAGGVAVEIFALADNGLLHYGRFHLNLAAALEDDIIGTINRRANMSSRTPTKA